MTFEILPQSWTAPAQALPRIMVAPPFTLRGLAKLIDFPHMESAGQVFLYLERCPKASSLPPG
jgi:hypothetical protein